MAAVRKAGRLGQSSSGCDSQKGATTPAAAWAESSLAEKVFQLARQAGVMSLPTQQVGMRVPDAVQPGHEPWTLWYRRGHS